MAREQGAPMEQTRPLHGDFQYGDKNRSISKAVRGSSPEITIGDGVRRAAGRRNTGIQKEGCHIKVTHARDAAS